MFKKTRKTKKPNIDKVLVIYRNNLPLSKIETQIVLRKITDEHIGMLATTQPVDLSGKCALYGYFVGQGTCLAKKLGLYGVSDNLECKACKSDTVISELNFIFNSEFGGRYQADWRAKKQRKHYK